MSEQLLGYSNDTWDSPRGKYLLEHGWMWSPQGYSPGWVRKLPGNNTYWCQETDAAFEKQKGLEGVAAHDMVSHPPHYNKTKYEVLDLIEEFFPNNYHLGNALKYLCRSQHKGEEIQDLKKLIFYVQRYIDRA